MFLAYEFSDQINCVEGRQDRRRASGSMAGSTEPGWLAEWSYLDLHGDRSDRPPTADEHFSRTGAGFGKSSSARTFAGLPIRPEKNLFMTILPGCSRRWLLAEISQGILERCAGDLHQALERAIQ